MEDRVANLLLRITGNNQDAKRALREVAAEAREFAAKNFEAHVGVRGVQEAKAQLQSLENALTLVGQRDVTARVRVKVDQERATLANLRRELEHALSGGVGARPLQAILADIGRSSARIGVLGGELGKVGRTAIRLGGIFGEVGTRLATNVVGGFQKMADVGGGAFATVTRGAVGLAGGVLGAVVRGIAMIVTQFVAWAVIIAVLFPLISALVGVLVALAASLATAIAGALALAVAFGGALIPVIAVLVAAFKRIFDVTKAVAEQQKQAAQDAKDLKAAQEAQADAARSSADAQKNVQDALTDAYRAQRDSVDQLANAQLAQQSAQLGIEAANLRLERAKLNLKQLKDEARAAGPAFSELFQDLEGFDFDTGDVEGLLTRVRALPGGTDQQLRVKEAILEVAEATLNVKQAKQAEVDATHRLADAQARANQFAKEGVLAYAPYAAALRSAEQAAKRLTEANDKLSEVEHRRQERMKGFTRTEIDLGTRLLRTFRAIGGAFAGVRLAIFRGLLTFMEALAELLKDSAVQDGLNEVGDAIFYVFRQFAALLRMREVKDMFATLAVTGARLTRILGGRIFRDFMLIMLRIANAAAPALIELFEDFANWLNRLARGTEDADGLRRGVNRVVRSFRDWLRLIRAVGRVLLAMFRNGKDEGDSLVRTLTRILNRFARWLGDEENREKFKKWLHDSVETAKDMVKAVIGIYRAFKLVYDILNGIWEVFKGIADLIAKTPLGGVVKGLAGAAGSASGGGGPLDILKNLVKSVPGLGPLSGILGFARGGVVPGVGGLGDNRLIAAEGGEYMIRRSIVNAVGTRALDALNMGLPMRSALAGGSGGGISIGNINLPPAPAGAVPDARYQAVQLAKELSRRAG